MLAVEIKTLFPELLIKKKPAARRSRR